MAGYVTLFLWLLLGSPAVIMKAEDVSYEDDLPRIPQVPVEHH